MSAQAWRIERQRGADSRVIKDDAGTIAEVFADDGGAEARLLCAAPRLRAALRDMIGLAEEAIALRRESLDPEDHELLPVYQQQWETARALLSELRDAA